MVYRKKSKKSKKGYSKKRYPFSKREIKTIQKLSRHTGELKFKGTVFSTPSLTISSPFERTISDMSVSQGSDYTQRIGTKISIKEIHYKCKISQITSSLVEGKVWVHILQTKDDNIGTKPSRPLEYFPMSQDSYDQYKILYSKYLNIGDKFNKTQEMLDIKVKSKYGDILFNTGSNDVEQHNILFRVVSENNIINVLGVDLYTRIKFYDN